VLHILGTSRNVTQDRNFNKELEQHIQQLKGAVTNLEEFTYIASHDIQEPLRRIASFSERMKEKFAPELNSEANQYLDRIISSSRNAHHLIDGLRAFLQLDHQHTMPTKTDLNLLVEEVREELELRLEESGAKLIIHTLPVIEVVPVQIKQLFTNLFANSIKFRSGQAPLTIEVSGHLIPATPSPDSSKGEYCEIIIRDNGIGFDESHSQNMFQMFQRFHPRSDYPGAGIGLAICKKIVTRHHGFISAQSKPGDGAQFTLLLPVYQASPL
jgi:light-regulated signal transduction histidine kinase (bacteriophytochrome)